MPDQNFTTTLTQLEDGTVVSDLNDRLVELVTAMQRQAQTVGGKPKGSLTLKLDVKLDGGAFEITADITSKLPRAPRSRSILWATRDGQLSPQNPKQLEMDMESPRNVAATSRSDIRMVNL